MKKITKVLIANRGEIAVRVMRTATQMGYTTVAIFSDADRDSLHVECADESVALGGLSASESYLSIEKVIAAATQSGADAIHPGYGFLSENTHFAEACQQAGIIFIGPPASAIKLMGSKRLSKIAMIESGVPCVPGYQGEDQDDATLLAQASEIGVPLMIKASAGGGGRGMRLVTDHANFANDLDAARSEAKNAFASDEMILERAVIEPRHIEIQVFADKHGNVIHLGERDCSIQRRHQKVVEESPSPFVDADLRQKMGQAAVNAAKACDYVGAGTVEFLVDADKNFYFLEMNTRLQVEHPVTEMVTGLDLVELQLRVANGEPLPITQAQVELKGHAIEVRVYAEDPRDNFVPQSGQILSWKPSAKARIDSGIREGQIISPYYDPMLAKVITWSETREQAITKLANTLADTELLGVNNNIRFLADVISRKAFIDGDATTGFLAQQYPDENYQASKPEAIISAIAGLLFFRKSQLDHNYSGRHWRRAVAMVSQYTLIFNDDDYSVSMSFDQGIYSVTVADEKFEFANVVDQYGRCSIELRGQRIGVNFSHSGACLHLQHKLAYYTFEDVSYAPARSAMSAGDEHVRAAMDGAIVDIKVAKGDHVNAGDVVAILEAMKMAHQLKAGVDGVIDQVNIEIGQQVKSRQILITTIQGGV
ncbi:MAG: geranyl-CoA carboxylase alpha subunit [Arenicella sp.]|jgi:geranyl-CoA carboxylase alpha subunit